MIVTKGRASAVWGTASGERCKGWMNGGSECIKVLHYLELQNNFNWQFNYFKVLGKICFAAFFCNSFSLNWHDSLLFFCLSNSSN